MSEVFNVAFEKGEVNEGGYCKVRGDRGGRTYEGIAENDNPGWKGWPKIDAWIAQNGDPGYNHKFTDIPGLEDDVKEFFAANYWTKMHGDEIASKNVAIYFYDWFINSASAAVKHLQLLVGISPTTGFFGDLTLRKVNEAGDGLLDTLHQTRDDFYSAHVRAVPGDAKFLQGWDNRSDNLYNELKAAA